MASKPPFQLILPDGRPLVRETLAQEIAAPTRASVRTIQSGHPARGLDPAKLGSILRSAEEGDGRMLEIHGGDDQRLILKFHG